jgi:ribokinase
MIGCVGTDPFGDALLAGLRSEGVDLSRVARSGLATGVALITVDAAGENTIVVAPGANADVTPELVRNSEERIASADALVTQLEVPLPAVLEAARIARKAGVRVILNPAPAQAAPASLLALADYLIPNQHEAAALAAGVTAEEQAWRLRNRTGATIVVTLGANGVLALDGVGCIRVGAYPVEAVDSTAAGDAFVAAFTVAICEGQELRQALRTGCAAGGLACSRLGAQPSLPSRLEVGELAATAPERRSGPPAHQGLQ